MKQSNKNTCLTDRRNNRRVLSIQSAGRLALLVVVTLLIEPGLNLRPVRVAEAAVEANRVVGYPLAAGTQNGRKPTPVDSVTKPEDPGANPAPRQSAIKLGPAASVTITPVAMPSAGNNDYTVINAAVQSAGSGDTINLSGTFNWMEPFAAASWAKGSDGIAGNTDDFSIYPPAGLNNITFTASSLGAATIQGPGDLANVNLEGVFFFDGGPNQGWTISNIRFLDFDNAIGFFNGAGGVTAFNNTKIMDNFIKVAKDLDSATAAADVSQNIGIHFSFGTNQMISGNMIDLDGSAVRTNDAAEVGMQSNTSGGSVYDGLQITNNIVHVLNAQSVNPEVILGIWENSHGHTSNITISGNQFTNLAGGNNPALNLERAFRVTSHSSMMTTVKYQNNTAQGANIGFQWLAGSDFSGNQPVQLISNTIINNDTGVLIQSNGTATLSFNRIASNAVGLNNSTANAISAENNWWGCNFGPGLGGAGCMGTANGVTNPVMGGSVDSNPWLVLKLTVAPGAIIVGGMSTLTADLTFNSDNVDTHLSGTIPDGTPVTFTGVNGTVSPMNTTTTSGKATSTYTGTAPGPGSASATVDMQTVSAPLIVNPAPCSITCPPNKTQSNDPNQCGAVVTYNAPTTTGTCGTVTCSPASGSFFPKGTTTVTCTTTAGPSCTFTVTVTDTQAPTITCPANVTAVTPSPGNSGVMVAFLTTASDNCPGVTIVCNPPSNSTFPLGCTTVNCTATDTSNNTATCNFQVCVFDICLQDDSNPNNRILINTSTGDYRFCCNGTTFTGRGKIAKQGNTYSLEHNAIDRRVRASVTGSAHSGNATLQSPAGTQRCNITDSNTSNNTTCGTCQ